MTSTRDAALEWVRSHRNFPQLHTVGRRGFPIGRSTIFPLEDDWSIDATGYRGNARVRQIAENPHVEAMWLDTTGPWNRAVRVRGTAYHTDGATLVRVYDRREDEARARGEGFGKRLEGQAIIDTVCCTHVTPRRVVLEGFDGPGSVHAWDVDPASLRPAPPRADATAPATGPTGFRQPLEMSIPEVSAKALAWARGQGRNPHLYTVRSGFPAGGSAAAWPADDWTTDVVLPREDEALAAARRDPHVELAWIAASHDAGKTEIPVIVFLRGLATEVEPAAATGVRERLGAAAPRGAVGVLRVRPARIRTEGFGQGLQLYAWNPAKP